MFFFKGNRRQLRLAACVALVIACAEISFPAWGESKTAPATYDAPPAAQIKIATFNIRVFSTRSRDDRELESIAELVKDFDLVCIQECRDEEVLDRLIRTLDQVCHRKFTWLATRPLGRGVKELYVWLYQQEKIYPQTTPIVYEDPKDDFIREPSAVCFKTPQGFDFTAAQVHLLFGDSAKDRRKEANLLGTVMDWFAHYPSFIGETDFFLAGDFNLSPLDESFASLQALGYASIKKDEGTTIAESPFDTFWISRGLKNEYPGLWGMERFDETLYDNVDSRASREVSDHRPVWIMVEACADTD